jgi:integrase
MNRKLNEKTLDRIAVPAGVQQLIVWDDELPGFGAVVGKKTITFIANYRANGAKRRQVIGRRGAIRDDGNPWTVTLARLRAREILGKVAGGGDPSFELRNRDTGPTLGDAFDLHIARMTADEASASSLATIKRERDKYLVNWVGRPLRTIERADCRELHQTLTKQHGPYLANRVMRHIRAAWNTALKEHDLPANPTIAVHWNKEHRRQEPIPWSGLPAWFSTVSTLRPLYVNGKRAGADPGVRGDYYLFMLLTGLRRMDAATVRWEHLDLDTAILVRPNPKGGKERAFKIPLSSECLKLLDRRKRDNRIAFPDADAGWVFPTRAIKPKTCALCSALGRPAHAKGAVVHVIEGKQQKINAEIGELEVILPSPHRLRDTHIHQRARRGRRHLAVRDRRAHQPPPATRLSHRRLHRPIDRTPRRMPGASDALPFRKAAAPAR